MGIRGLTTYISNNSRLYLSPHKLFNSLVIIDGNNISSQLYNWVSKSNSAFGGDYDRYYKCVSNFFALLKQCKVTPLVIFDGGYETRKLGTVWSRLRNKLLACRKVNPKNQLRRSVFPLLMKDTFRDILLELGISFAQCDFEADDEIAALARELNCPVLSYDSDFFVYDVKYIPFNSFELSATIMNDPKTGETYSYIGCEIYNVENFLRTFGGLQKGMLPLMATLLGNDYIKRDLFDAFYSQIHMPKRRRGWTEQHRRIAGLLDWLRRETITSAIPKILSHLKQKDRVHVERQVQRAITVYSRVSSPLKKYLQVPELSNSFSCSKESVSALSEVNEASSEDENLSESIIELTADESKDVTGDEEDLEDKCIDIINKSDISSDEPLEEVEEEEGENILEEEAEMPGNLPASFVHRFRQGLLPSCFMDLLTKSRFYILQPQKEDYTLPESSHAASLPLLRHIVTLLLGVEDASKVKVIARRQVNPTRRPLFNEDIKPAADLPSLSSLPSLPQDKKLALLLQPTGVANTLDILPEEWRLFFLAISYWATHSKQPPVSDKHIHAVVLGVILLALVYPCKKQNKELAPLLGETAQKPLSDLPDVKSALMNVKSADCKVLFGSIYVPHSHAEGRNHKASYDISVVHSFAQLQSILLMLTQLNQLLEMPLKASPLHRLFSGTLLYNLYRALEHRVDVQSYLALSLNQTPSVLVLHNTLTTTLLAHLAPDTPRSTMFRRARPRRKRKREVSESSETNEGNKRRESGSDSDAGTVDPSNRFALLSTE